MNYFEFNERRTRHSVPQRVVSADVVEWPEIVVTEGGELTDDQLLQLSLMVERQNGESA